MTSPGAGHVTRHDVRRRLERAARRIGAYSEWHDACCEARAAGWTERDVYAILDHATTIHFLQILVFVTAIIIIAKVIL